MWRTQIFLGSVVGTTLNSLIQVRPTHYSTFFEAQKDFDIFIGLENVSWDEILVHEWCGQSTQVNIALFLHSKITRIINIILWWWEPPVWLELIGVRVGDIHILKVHWFWHYDILSCRDLFVAISELCDVRGCCNKRVVCANKFILVFLRNNVSHSFEVFHRREQNRLSDVVLE